MKKFKYNSVNFEKFSKNFFSQNGEDGIILKALELIKAQTKANHSDKSFAVDVGAWDGKHFSNTYHLISEHSFGSVLIECDRKKFKELESNMIHFDNQYLFNQFIDVTGDSNLDSILTLTPIPRDFELLSIDIDGMDYYIWESLSLYFPKLVIIEFNPTIPEYVEFVQRKDFAIKHGASLKSLVKLGSSKGYVLIAKTHCNVIFMAEHLANLIGFNTELVETKSNDFFDENATYLFSGFNGELISNHEELTLPWHGVSQSISSLNALPSFLQKYPHDYSKFEEICFGLFSNVKKSGFKGVKFFVKGIFDEYIANFLNQLSPAQRKFVRKVKAMLTRK
jgi:hypothetical protein